MPTVLVTGGAGFIGSHLVDALLARGERVRVLDNLDSLAHPEGTVPEHLSAEAELVRGDLGDPAAVERALEGVDRVFHLGGAVGNGESMMNVRRAVDANCGGTATLLEAVLDQEELALVLGGAYGLEAVVLRYLNVYGPRQALGNPYTGVAAIFAARVLSGRRPLVFEDGGQVRDLVHVSDVVRATLAAMDAPAAPGHAINVAAGRRIEILELARSLARELGREELEPELPGEFRAGDIRHCLADTTRARELLGFEAQTELADGLPELAEWVAGQTVTERGDEAVAEMRARNLVG